jgi:hypothetical protein
MNRNRLKTITKITDNKTKHSHPLTVEDFELYDVNIEIPDNAEERGLKQRLLKKSSIDAAS